MNKAAFLLSEGGSSHGVDVKDGIGRETLGKVYLAAIARLPKAKAVSFTEFRELVIRSANELGTALGDTATKAFAAVGLS